MSTSKSQPPAVVTFRPDFCSPAYLNSLLRLQHLHWLEIHRRPGPADGAATAAAAVSTFQFVIPACQSNLVCVLGTEVPHLESALGCRVRQIPVPDYVAPDGLKAFSVDYAEQQRPAVGPAAAQAGHARFLAALGAICFRLQLTRICVNPSDGGGGGGCGACAKVRTHTKSVRRASAARPRLRPPRLTLDLARAPTRRRPASAEAAAAGDSGARKPAAAAAAAAVEKMTDAAANSLVDRLLMSDAATGAAALLATAASETLRICSGGSCRQRPPHWCQFALDSGVALVVAEAVASRERLRADVVGVFAGWAAALTGRLLAGCVRLAADAVSMATVAAARVADAAAGRLLCGLADEVAAQMAQAERLVVRVSLPCDWRTSRSLLGLQPLRRRCTGCGAGVIAEPAGTAGYRLTVRSRGRCCSRHASLLQLADCARSSKDAGLGGLLLQEVASLPPAGGE